MLEMTDDVQRSLGRIEGKLDNVLERMGDSDKRISAIEKKVWWSSGAAAIVAFIATRIHTP